MTAQRDLKNLIRARQAKTGESYSTARKHILRERAVLLGPGDNAGTKFPARVDAVVLKVSRQSARVRVLGEPGELTFRSPDILRVVPGHLVTLTIERRWSWYEDAYANGRIEDVRVDVTKIGLVPLTLDGGELRDVAGYSDPFEEPDPYAALWMRLTAQPRLAFEFDAVAWGSLPNREFDDNPTCEAAELADAGDFVAARKLLMETLGVDLRCLDAHAHLGNWAFDRSPERALAHYEVGVRIGELSLPSDFSGLLLWGELYNRPFLRCLHGLGLCLWRLGRLAEAEHTFERLLALNPADHQGVRFCWHDVRQRRSWQELEAAEARRGQRARRRSAAPSS